MVNLRVFLLSVGTLFSFEAIQSQSQPQIIEVQANLPSQVELDDGKLKPCGKSFVLHNRTERKVKVVYSWSGLRKSRVISVKSDKQVEVGPVYCPSLLIVLTGKELKHSVGVNPAETYDISWSVDKKMFIIDPVARKENRNP